MTTLTTPYDASATGRRVPGLRRMLAGAAVFDAAGGIFCLAGAGELARWLSISRGAGYATAVAFLAASAAGALALRRDATTVAPVVVANEVFAAWCLLLLAVDSPNAVGVALLTVAAVTSAATGAAEMWLARRR
jgi:hypothetical protein